MCRASIAFSITLLACVAVGDDRLFVRTSSDGSQTEIGTKANADARTCTIRFTLAQAEAERWPEPVTINIKESATSSLWSITLESRFAKKPHTVRAPTGAYELTFEAAHHQPLHGKVRLDVADVNLGTLTLVRYPLLTGRVRAADGSPIVGAFVTDRAGLAVKSDSLGAFALEIESTWPSQIEVSYPGLTTKEIAVPKTQVSASLPAVTLVKGSRIGIEIEGVTEDVDVDLASKSDYKRVNVLKSAHVSKDAPHAAFEDLDKGEYVVVVRGGGPLQRLATRVVVGEGESVTKQIRVEPIAVDMQVHRGESAVAGAVVAAQSDDNQWSSDFRTNSEGHVSVEAWERGQYTFAVRVTETSAPQLLFDRIEGTSEATVRLEVPDRTIVGRVVDADDGSPVARADVQVESTNDDETGGTLTVVTGANGEFVVDGLRDGSHTLVAEAESYIRSEPIMVRLDQSSRRREVNLRVSHGISRALRVTTRAGIPIRGAIVIEMVGAAVTGVFKTDELGHVTLHTPSRGTAVVYVLPAEGSFAIARLPSKPSEHDESIVVPDGNATLELHANDSTGKPIPHLQFLMRYDGELIPPDVADVLQMRRGIAATTGPDGVARLERLPSGFFELWPVRTREELQNIIAGGAMSAPVQVALKEGLNVASMTFTRKR